MAGVFIPLQSGSREVRVYDRRARVIHAFRPIIMRDGVETREISNSDVISLVDCVRCPKNWTSSLEKSA